jgi:hypothetical protein
MKRPVPIENPDLSEVVKAVEEYFDYIDSHEYHEDGLSDYEYAIFELLVETLYGSTVWKWINDRIII